MAVSGRYRWQEKWKVATLKMRLNEMEVRFSQIIW
jgi:hypothetical protein